MAEIFWRIDFSLAISVSSQINPSTDVHIVNINDSSSHSTIVTDGPIMSTGRDSITVSPLTVVPGSSVSLSSTSSTLKSEEGGLSIISFPVDRLVIAGESWDCDMLEIWGTGRDSITVSPLTVVPGSSVSLSSTSSTLTKDPHKLSYDNQKEVSDRSQFAKKSQPLEQQSSTPQRGLFPVSMSPAPIHHFVSC
jgi:hypothetical protein